jgi:hypothetical protein
MIPAASFRAQLRAAPLIQLFDYWQCIRGRRLMPSWSDIRPEEIASVLPQIWAWRLDDGDEPRIRLVGERILEVIRRNVRQKSAEDLYPAPQAAAIRARILKVAKTPTCSFTIGKVFDGKIEVGLGERLTLPYADTGGRLGVIGASNLAATLDAVTGLPISFRPTALYYLEGDEVFMELTKGFVA